MNSAPTNPYDQALAQIREYAEYLRDEGVSTVEVDPQIIKALQKPAPSLPSPPPLPHTFTPPPPPPPPAPSSGAPGTLSSIAARVAACTLCPLHSTRTKTVPGQGCSTPEILFIGEGPGEEEDQQGLAFVGKAGQLLTKIIGAMGLARENVFIGNIVKCRPPNNRAPLPDEMHACLPYLKEQIALLKPKVIVALGGTAAKALLNTETGITKLRGQWHRYEGIPLMPTYHPAYLLRNEAGKPDVWADMKAVLQHLGRTPPAPKKARVQE